MRTEQVVFAGLVGLGAGLLLGLVFAPRSGKETQELVRQKTREGLDQLAASGKRVGGQLHDLAAKSQDLAARGAAKSQDLAARGKEEVTDALGAGQRAYNRAASGD